MAIITDVLRTLLFLYFVLLIGRLIFDWVQVFARDWRPRGVVLILAEAIYTATDPPLKALRKVLPVIRIGGVGLDLSFLVLMIVISMAMSIL
ncbi:MAG TPA: YggT family protein [Tetrasphaera sp.]|uniref:YggT family protein n=1 Tax=Nostocoides vanveenii TaxID=330835 RepID=A0ABN2K4B5_9MICO|nr:YggT family protein [Tetrasphaera sp.]HNQ08251.1 YggT family protein [Tetrasphaera sp.]